MTLATHNNGLYLMTSKLTPTAFYCGCCSRDGDDMVVEKGGNNFKGMFSAGCAIVDKQFTNFKDSCKVLDFNTQGSSARAVTGWAPILGTDVFTASVGYSPNAASPNTGKYSNTEIVFFGLFNMEIERNRSSYSGSFSLRLELKGAKQSGYTLYNGATYADYVSGYLYVVLENPLSSGFNYDYSVVYDSVSNVVYAYVNGQLKLKASLSGVESIGGNYISIRHESNFTPAYVSYIKVSTGAVYPASKPLV